MKRFVLVGMLLMGCTHYDHSVVYKDYPGDPSIRLETERTMRQLREADLVIRYESEARVFLSKPTGSEEQLTVGIDDLNRAAGQYTTNRTLVVVTMGPPMRMLPDEQFAARVDEIENILTQVGFRKVVFHLASAMGIPIYRE